MNVIATPTHAGGRTSQKEINVIGTMQLLAACQKAPSVRRLVVKSSAAVYGSSPRDPAMFTEDMGPKAMPRAGFGKDSVEVEGYVRGFSRRRPDVEIAMLRFANIIGPGIRTSMTDYFALPVVPVPLGYDARLQFVHEDDAVGALLLATTGDAAGIVNIAGDGVITVAQAAAIAGGVPCCRCRCRLPGSRHRSSSARARRLPHRPDGLPRLRPWSRHPPDARGAGVRAAFTTRRGLRGLRPRHRLALPGGGGTGAAGPAWPALRRPRSVTCGRPEDRLMPTASRRQRRPPAPRRRPRASRRRAATLRTATVGSRKSAARSPADVREDRGRQEVVGATRSARRRRRPAGRARRRGAARATGERAPRGSPLARRPRADPSRRRRDAHARPAAPAPAGTRDAPPSGVPPGPPRPRPAPTAPAASGRQGRPEPQGARAGPVGRRTRATGRARPPRSPRGRARPVRPGSLRPCPTRPAAPGARVAEGPDRSLTAASRPGWRRSHGRHRRDCASRPTAAGSRPRTSSATSPRRWPTCAGGSPATTPSTSSASTRTSPPLLPARCCARSTGRGSGSRCAASRTSRRPAARLVVANHSGTIAWTH